MQAKLLRIGKCAIMAVHPKNLVSKYVNIVKDKIKIGNDYISLKSIGKIVVVGAGKASGTMAFALEEKLNGRISNGVVIVKDGYGTKCRYIKILEAGHPVPDFRSIEGTKAIKDVLKDLTADDLVIVLISGGGSSLMELPVNGVTLEDMSMLTQLLLRSGAPIRVLNIIRSSLSQVKCGGLATWALPARVCGLILSDVIGNNLEIIASGPTVAPKYKEDKVKETINLLHQYGVWDNAPNSVKIFLLSRKGFQNKPERSLNITRKVSNYIIGDIHAATNAAVQAVKKTGFNSYYLSSYIEGEAREVAKVFAGIAREIKERGRPVKPPCIVVAGGELTVKVKGNGAGGRCQELALAFALAVGEDADYGSRGIPGVSLLAIGTDGTDGPTDAAGAYADWKTIRKAKVLGLDPRKFLENNDVYHFFEVAGGLIKTGSTGTNVGDLYLLGIK